MIRRSPTRIELKLEDLSDFEYIQKFEKKKNPSGNVLTTADAQKLVRQDRIGLGFRPIRASSNVGIASFTGSTLTSTIGGGGTPGIPTPVTPVTPTNNDNTPVEMNLTNVGDDFSLLESVRAQINNTNTSTMSLDESL